MSEIRGFVGSITPYYDLQQEDADGDDADDDSTPLVNAP